MATHTEYNAATDASTVADAFPDQIANKIILITGVSPGGIGGVTAKALAAKGPKLLILASRTPDKVQAVIKDIEAAHPESATRFLELDLGSQKSARKAAAELMGYADLPRIDVLINNAAVMNLPERTLSPEGIETTFATNHIGHFLFTNLIMEKLLAAAKTNHRGETRIVNVASLAINTSPVRFSDYNFEKTLDELPESERPKVEHMAQFGNKIEGSYHGSIAYGQSKTANVLFSVALTQKLYEKHGILSYGLHPGLISTELARYMDPALLQALKDRVRGGGMSGGGMQMKSLEQGASTTLVAALDPKLGAAGETRTGVWLKDCQVEKPIEWAIDPASADKLWTLSEELVGKKFPL